MENGEPDIQFPISNFPSPLGRGAWGLLWGLGGLLAVGLPFMLRSRGEIAGIWPGLVVIEISLVGGLAVAAWGLRKDRRDWCCGALALLSVGLLHGVTQVAAALEPEETIRPLAQQIAAQGQPGDRLVAFHSYDQGLNFYTGQRVMVIGDPGELTFGRDHAPDAADYFYSGEDDFLRLLRAPGRTFALLRRQDWARLRPQLPPGTQEWGRGRKHILIFQENPHDSGSVPPATEGLSAVFPPDHRG